MPYTPRAAGRSHTLGNLHEDAVRRQREAERALAAATRDEDRDYLRAVIETAQGYADRLRAAPGFVLEG